MATIIKIRQVVEDSWQLLEQATDGAIPAEGDVIVPLALWRRERAALLAHDGRLGLLLDSSEEPEAIVADLAHFDVIAVNFPKFTDGRGYSTARLLRDRYGYQGEIRAIGDVQ